jgi:PilZ domain
MSAILARKQHRRAFRRGVLVTCEVVRERDFRRVARLGLDLSTDGMLVATRDVVLTGEELIVSFRAPMADKWFDCMATVARVVHGRRPGDRGRCLGLAFHGNSSSWQRALFDELRGLPAVRSRRPGAIPS